MPNDAKLGLLAGVIGVIVAAAISGKPAHEIAGSTPPGASSRSSPAQQILEQPTSVTETGAKSSNLAAPAAVPGEQ